MYESLLISSAAKKAAAQALILRSELPKCKQFGIDEQTAREYGISSGVFRAKQLIANKYLPYSDAIKTARFYARFRHCHTPKCEGAINLWGGRAWCRHVYFVVYGKRL